MLFLQLVLCVLHFMINDIWGGMMVILVTAFGYQVYKYDMDFTWAMCYGLVVAMETVFDLIHLAIRVGQVPEPFFKKYMLLDIILIAAPILSAIQAWMMHRVYTSYLHQETEVLLQQERMFAGYNGPPAGAAAPPPRNNRPPTGGHVGSDAGNRPYDWNSAGVGRAIG